MPTFLPYAMRLMSTPTRAQLPSAFVHPLSHHTPPTDLLLRRAHLLRASLSRPRTPLSDRSAASPPRTRITTSIPPASTHSVSAPSSKCRPAPPSSPQRRTSHDRRPACPASLLLHPPAPSFLRARGPTAQLQRRSHLVSSQPFSPTTLRDAAPPYRPHPHEAGAHLRILATPRPQTQLALQSLPIASLCRPLSLPPPAHRVAQRSPRRSGFSRLSGSSAFPGPGALDAPLSSTPRFALEPADF
ncbi:hypothetical protein DFH08DRAFT_962899 [Mycena albidolilacea]|uniref:Uncharacterized protein n=1 Tax=Mycena albidolilacea TaxID=1033008 RepID=A0AAD7ENB0_9AGAR|nr:hypothetical protein DFH08DRAFT_1011332 [Mycena albidolilacea]KAJ7342871.1 hypothetical protein DFH08DRAFT_962899 [Mycena albidolilacea]